MIDFKSIIFVLSPNIFDTRVCPFLHSNHPGSADSCSLAVLCEWNWQTMQNIAREEAAKGNTVYLNNPRYGAWWKSAEHRSLWSDYNKKWKIFLNTNPNIDNVLDYGRILSKE